MTDDAPDFSRAAAALGDPVRARMIAVLMDGRARTATELALEGGVAPSTASVHLARLCEVQLVCVVRQGRHRYHRISGEDAAVAVESLMRLPPVMPRPLGPRDAALREARVCYDHLAGRLGVALAAAIDNAGLVSEIRGDVQLTDAGRRWLRGIGLDPGFDCRRSACRYCLDWSERRVHLAGALGALLLGHLLARRHVTRQPDSRALHAAPSAWRFVETIGRH